MKLIFHVLPISGDKEQGQLRILEYLKLKISFKKRKYLKHDFFSDRKKIVKSQLISSVHTLS